MCNVHFTLVASFQFGDADIVALVWLMVLFHAWLIQCWVFSPQTGKWTLSVSAVVRGSHPVYPARPVAVHHILLGIIHPIDCIPQFVPNVICVAAVGRHTPDMCNSEVHIWNDVEYYLTLLSWIGIWTVIWWTNILSQMLISKAKKYDSCPCFFNVLSTKIEQLENYKWYALNGTIIHCIYSVQRAFEISQHLLDMQLGVMPNNLRAVWFY